MNLKPNRILTRLVALLVILTLIPSGMSLADSASRPENAIPFGEQIPSGSAMQSTLLRFAITTFLSGDVFQDGADRLTTLQNADGGWDWPLNDGNPNTVSPTNTVGPIAQGLAKAYLHTNDSAHLAALQDAGGLLLGKTNNFSPSDGYLAATLDGVFGGTTYTDHVMNNFYGPLAAGTYNRNGLGTLYNTESYVNLIRVSRASQGIGNLAAWDVGMGLVGAAACGADTAAWIAGTQAEIEELNPNAYYDVIGLAGAIYGLAYVGANYNPSAGPHSAAESLDDLGAILASYQLNTGGFTWNSNYMGEGEYNETIQETAYAVLALEELDRATYIGAIQQAANYMVSVQLGTGGWANYEGSGENNEITGEALWSIHVVYSSIFDGFFQPIDMSIINVAKAGQTIPVKWRLTDENGLPIADPASFVKLYSYAVGCETGVPADAIEEYNPGASGLQYLGDGYWQFNWKTPKAFANTCRSMYVAFQGGFKSPVVSFRFR